MSLLLLFRGPAGNPQPPVVIVDDKSGIDGKKRGRKFRTADDDLTEAEVQWMQRKLRELKQAKTERERVAAAKALEVSLAQAAQDDEAAEAISSTIEQERPALKADYRAIMRDVELLSSITTKLAEIAKRAAEEQRRRQDDDEIELISLIL